MEGHVVVYKTNSLNFAFYLLLLLDSRGLQYAEKSLDTTVKIEDGQIILAFIDHYVGHLGKCGKM